SNQLQSALDSQLSVKPIAFGWVAGLVALYIALIGPGDYFFVRRVLKRMEATWITFPAIVVAISIGAYLLANAMKGNALRVNQVEIVDVDTAGNFASGSIVTHFFSPRVARYELHVEPKLGAVELQQEASLTAWLGVPGPGLGGMQGNGGNGLFDRGYAVSPDRSRLLGLPVQEWSTKTLTARWAATTGPSVESQLRVHREELLAGAVTNRTGVALDDCVLLHGNWAYRLNTLADGASRVLDDQTPRTVATVLTNTLAGENADVRAADDGTVAFQPYSHDITRLLKLMMFFQAVGGDSYSSSSNAYQSYLDLSHLLDGNQAVLLARVPSESASHWFDEDRPLAGDADRRWVFYRFILPVDSAESSAP
ncbi:MAG: hypothetical protein KDA61_04500, partial [Planctomycetales bacterium]|nr:hypothetical protein [Planctomycetales bacterium]